jgi:protoporphyrinogen oxidase
MYTILGAGLAGLAVADHLRKKGISFSIYEAKAHGGGHIHSEQVDGFTWDEGPHVSFTKSQYVKQYFAENLDHRYLEFETTPANYYKGNWIPHPAQSNMYAVPEPLRTESINDLKKVRENLPKDYVATNYEEWLNYAFGETFKKSFPEAYTEKYWTTLPENLTTDWIGKRVYFPDVDDMVHSANGPLQKQTHYLTQFRYPETGGFYSYIKKVEESLRVNYNKKLEYLSFENKELHFLGGEKVNYEKLVSTLPLPQLIVNSDAPAAIKTQAKKLKCSQVLIVNVVVDHPAPIPYQWIYVYDKEMYSTRVNFTESLSPNNGEAGKSGIQVEVYFSDYRPLTKTIEHIEQKVLDELVTMKLAVSRDSILTHHSKWINWANVIFDLQRTEAQNAVFSWLETKGMVRESDDLEPMTDWDKKLTTTSPLGDIILAGRFAQWKYYWTDDCVLRGLFISKANEK